MAAMVRKGFAFLLTLSLILAPASAGKVYYNGNLVYDSDSTPSFLQQVLQKLKLVIFQYNQKGSIAGHSGTINYATDTSASFTFDLYGRIDFSSNGYGENDKVQVQLIPEYGRYFCSTNTCGGISNWISDKATITAKPGVTLWTKRYTGIAEGTFGTYYKAENFPCLAGRFGYNQYYWLGVDVSFSGNEGVSGHWQADKEIDLFNAIKNQGIDASGICPQYYIAPTPIPTPSPIPAPQTDQPGVTVVDLVKSLISWLLS